MDQLSSMVSSLTLNSADSELTCVRDSAKKVVDRDAKQQEEVIQMMFKRCQEDWRFSSKAVSIFQDLSDIESQTDNVKFRMTLLKTLQGYHSSEKDNACTSF